MNFTLSVHKQIMESPVGSSRPEQGGALFSSDGGVTVDKFIFDEKGSRYTSAAWAAHLEHLMNTGTRSLVFIIGGAYGVSEKVRERADSMLSLSDMTFSHQIIRLFFEEQLYRAMTIIKGEPYHNE